MDRDPIIKPEHMQAIENPDSYIKKQKEQQNKSKEKQINEIEKCLGRKLTFSERKKLMNMSEEKLKEIQRKAEMKRQKQVQQLQKGRGLER